MDNSSLSVLSVNNLSVCYGEREVLHKISADFRCGRLTAIIGPNGSGKSTLLKTVIGIIPKSGGEIISEGISTKTLSTQEIARRIAYLPQMKNVPDLTVRTMVLHGRFSHLSYPRHYREKDMRAVDEALKITGLTELAEKKVSTLSGGTVQLVFLAMALAQNSPVILMDEPTSFLDISHQIRLMELCGRLTENKKTVIAVLHDLPLALKYADEVKIMKSGEIVFEGTPLQTFESGVLDSVFGVKVKSVEIENGRIYYCE